MMRRILLFLPVLVVIVLGGFFVWGLNPNRDPNAIPSARLSKPVPEFALLPITGLETPGLSSADLKSGGDPIVLNIFASWCVPCRAEHAVLTRLVRDEKFELVGINYKDKPEDARAWLTELGNPYTRIGADENGRAGIDWGISGVPETFLVNGDGVVVWRYVGPIATEQSQNELRRALEQARNGGGQ